MRISHIALGVMLGWGSLVVAETSGLAAESLPDDGSRITITSPQDGETVGRTFTLHYELQAGSQAHHAHVYLDGQYQKGFSGTFTNLPPGRHEIQVVAATKDHKPLAASATVAVVVK
jgi:hypothetical protein